VTNLGKYNEGDLCGEYLKLPATKEDVKSILSNIGVDGVLYEEFFITDYITNLAGMHNLGEYESIDELNYLASLLSDMDKWELEKFEAAAVYGDHSGSAQDMINLAQNLDCYEYYPEISNYKELGDYMFNELEYVEISERLLDYIDYEAYGRDYAINEGGEFINGGYISRNGESFHEHYKGWRDMPDEYKIFAYPDPPEKMPINAQLDMYGKMAATQLVAAKTMLNRDERV